MTAIAASSSTTKKEKKTTTTQTGPTVKKKRNRSVRIQLKNGRIYDSENGKTCHQCRQKTLDFSLSCKHLTGNTESTLHFCYKCLLNRYGEIAEEIAGTGCQWKCPLCRGVCNCCKCMKKRGLEPTGILIPIAKSRGFSSVSEMLQLEKVESPKEDESASEKKRRHSHEVQIIFNKHGKLTTMTRPGCILCYESDALTILDTSVDIKIGIRENDPNEKPDSKCRPKANAREARKRKKLVTEKEDDNDNNVIGERKSKAAPTDKKKRSRSVRIQLKNGRIYGSENGKSCHQCRQKTLDFSLSCKNLTGNTECTLHFCYKCLLNRYGEIAEEIAGTGCQWKCPRCRGVCNCCICMKKRGLEPTGVLIPIAKSKGFSSVSEMLQLEKVESPKEDESASEKKRRHSHEDTSVDIKIGRRENDPNEKPDSKCRPKDNAREARKRKKLVTKKEDDNDNNVIGVRKSKAAPRMKVTSNGLALNFLGDSSNKSKVPTNTDNTRPPIKNEPVEEVLLDQKNEVKMQIEVSDTEIPLPQGTELTKVANFDLLAEDVGHALQFLEFCEAFAQVLDLKKGEPELLLKEIFINQDSHRSHRYSIKMLCIKLLSIIRHDAEEGYSSEDSIERNPLLEALSDAKCLQFPSELTGEDSDLKTDGYIELNSSRKLRILNFLCDEALDTQELRNWIEVRTLELVEQQNKANKVFQDLEKKQGKKLRDRMTKAFVLRNGAPLSISEHANLVSLIKVEVSKSLAEKLEAENGEMNMKESDAVRSDPIVMDAFGRKFWKLKGYSCEMDILRQDVSHGDINFYEEKWFSYHISQKASMETYMSSFKTI